MNSKKELKKMQYQGTKFKTNFLSKNIPEDRRIAELIYWCKLFHEKNLTPNHETGSFGNLSFRIEQDKNQFIISSSGSDFNNILKNENFVQVDSCDFSKRIVLCHGNQEPSSEAMLHYAIYRNRPEISTIFHGHCEEILNSAEKMNIPVTSKEEDYGTMELVERVLEIIPKYNFLIMKNHGFISIGKTMKETGETTLDYLRKISGLN